MKKLLTVGIILMGAMAFTLTLANASSDSKEAPKEMKCQAGKCGGANMKCNDGKDMKKEQNTTKPVPKKGKCGTGKCG